MTLMDFEGVETFLNTKVKAVATIADIAAPKVATEVNAGTSLDLTMYLRDFAPEITTNTGTKPSRLGRGVDLPAEGKTTYAAQEIRYVYDPQGDAGDTVNKAYTLLKQGVELFFVVRKGKSKDEAFASGDQLEVWHVKCGRQNKTRSGDDEFSEYEISQQIFLLREPVEDAVAAA